MKPRVTVHCVASRYAGPNERIIEFSDQGLGGLISFRRSGNALYVEVYRADRGVIVRAGGQDTPAHDLPHNAPLARPTAPEVWTLDEILAREG